MTRHDDPFQLYDAGDFAGAERLAVEILAKDEDARLLHLAGLLACMRGDYSEGASRLERALAFAPGNVAIRTHLVRALIDGGRPAEALVQAPRPAPSPAAADLWRLRAGAAAAAGALPDRIEAERQADLAETGARLAATPDDRQLRLRRARLLGTFRRDAEAETDYQRLIASDPKDREAIAELGQLYDRGNRIDELERLLEAATQAGVPSQSLGYLHAVAAWRRKDLAAARSWLDRAGPGSDPVRFHALLARVADAQGETVEAAAAIEAKSAAVPDRTAWLAQSDDYRRRMRTFANVITAEWAAPLASARPGPRPSPIFLLGFPRSGTTLLDTFLMGHPAVRVLEEIPLIGFVAEAAGPLEEIPTIDDEEAERLRDIYFRRLGDHVEPGFDGLIVDKMPINTLAAPLIHRLFPDARLIFAKRHPCDCVLSGLMQNLILNPAMASFLDPRAASDFYDVTLEIWTRSVEHLPVHVHDVRYEELVTQPEPVMRKLAEFLGLEWRDSLADHRATARARGRISTASYDQVADPLYRGSAGRWARYREILDPALSVLCGWARRLGYEN